MSLRPFVVSTVIVLLFTLSSSAQTATQRLGTCLVQSSTGAQRIALARWIAFAIIAHPSVRDSVAVPVQVVNEADREIAAVFLHLLSVAYRAEAIQAFREDSSSIETAFESFGRVAMQEIMGNREVNQRIERYIEYIDSEAIGALFE